VGKSGGEIGVEVAVEEVFAGFAVNRIGFLAGRRRVAKILIKNVRALKRTNRTQVEAGSAAFPCA
jgi:hypothetical protein